MTACLRRSGLLLGETGSLSLIGYSWQIFKTSSIAFWLAERCKCLSQ